MTSLLELAGITVKFGGVTAVDNVSLSVRDGDLIGFIGPNGAGKTTLMRVIMGIVQPQQGSVSLAGQNLAGWPVEARVRAGLALSQQIVKPLRGFSLIENVTLACGKALTASPLAALGHVSRKRQRERAAELLARVGITAYAATSPREVPLGILKRLEVARALALTPKVLLLDEPLAGLNQKEAAALADLIKQLAADGQTIVLIEHNLREVMRICPLLYVQNNGAPLAFGPAQDVMSDQRVRRAYLGAQADA